MASSFLKTTLKRGGEAILAVALAFGLFFLELLLLARAFPQGTLLGDFVRPPREPMVAMITPPRGGRGPEFVAPEPQIVARLTDVYRKVKGRAASHILWDDAGPASCSGTATPSRLRSIRGDDRL